MSYHRMMQGPKSKDAERLFRKWLISEGWKRKQICHAVKTHARYQSREDILGSDILAFGPPDHIWFVQTTTYGGRAHRMRKIENIWECDGGIFKWDVATKIQVSVVNCEYDKDPENKRRRLYYWVVQDFLGGKEWTEKYTLGPFDKKEIEAIRLKEKVE